MKGKIAKKDIRNGGGGVKDKNVDKIKSGREEIKEHYGQTDEC